MTSLENYRTPKFVAHCSAQLTLYTKAYPGIEAALITTPDGFEIASYSHTQAHSNDKLAAVGSSLFALGSSLTSEFKLQGCKSVIIESERGKVFISPINKGQHSVVLMVQTNERATLGNIIHGAKKLNEAVSAELVDLPL